MKTEIESVERRSQVTPFHELANSLAELGRELYARGWVLGTSGNFSAVITRNPLRLAITSSGIDKGKLSGGQILQIDEGSKVVDGSGRPSDESMLHVTVARVRQAGAVLHTHSVWSTILSQELAGEGGLGLEGYEMLKGLSGIRTHQHREWLPIIENSQDMKRLAGTIEDVLEAGSASHGFLLRGHGLYTWGHDLAEAKRHVEILEFLLEVAGRTRYGRL